MGLRQRLNLARLYWSTDARPDGLLDLVRSAFRGGVDLVHLHHPATDPAVLAEITRQLLPLAPMRGLVVAEHQPAAPDTGVRFGDGLSVAAIRADLPHSLIGLAADSAEELDAALANPDVDFVVVGQLPGGPDAEPAVDLDLVARAAELAPPHAAKPWFAAGDITEDNLAAVISAGAHRVVVGAAIGTAGDPAAVAQHLRAELNAAWANGRTPAQQMEDAWISGTE